MSSLLLCMLFGVLHSNKRVTEQVAVLRGHSGLVKGVTWDPVSKYLASQVTFSFTHFQFHTSHSNMAASARMCTYSHLSFIWCFVPPVVSCGKKVTTSVCM